MKKIRIIVYITLLTVMLYGCKSDQNKDDTNNPSPSAGATISPETDDSNEGMGDVSEDRRVKDYFPLQADHQYIYKGEGNEFASFTRYTDFLDKERNRIQTRTNNGGTETVRVIEIKEGKVSVILKVDECYYRDNLLDQETLKEDDSVITEEILLMEPIVQGTEWTLYDGRRRYISGIDVKIETPAGSYKAIEVTTEEVGGTSKDYYAMQIGLVKSIYSSGDMEVTYSLSEINSDTPFTQVLQIYYPDVDEKIYAEPLTLSFHTNDVTGNVMQDALHQEANKGSFLPLASVNTKINSLFLGMDNIVYVDFSADLVKDMNVGAGYESLILQGITNTLGHYYGVQEVSITIDGKPYESGHIIMKKGETFQVDPDPISAGQ